MAPNDTSATGGYDLGVNETDEKVLVRRLMTAFELFEVGWEMRRQQLLRQYPDAPVEEIRRLLSEWLQAGAGSELVPPGFVVSDRFR